MNPKITPLTLEYRNDQGELIRYQRSLTTDQIAVLLITVDEMHMDTEADAE